MAKGYWIAHVTVTDPERYKDYVAANAKAFEKYNAKFLVRGGTSEKRNGPEAYERHVVLEFESYEVAKACYDSPEYQAAAKIRNESLRRLRRRCRGLRRLSRGGTICLSKLPVPRRRHEILHIEMLDQERPLRVGGKAGRRREMDLPPRLPRNLDGPPADSVRTEIAEKIPATRITHRSPSAIAPLSPLAHPGANKHRITRNGAPPHGQPPAQVDLPPEARPVPARELAIKDAPLTEPGEGEFRVKIEVISLDPAMRGWVNESKSYVKPVPLGGVMRGYAAGIIDASNHPGFKVGDAVQGLLGAQQYAISNGKGVHRINLDQAPIERWVGGLGMPGWTAYFGLLEVGQPKEGETVVVSAASGAVGSLVGQIAKIKGCRAVGIAGGPDKCRYLTDELGFDAAVDYKAGDLAAQLEAACPNGIDVNFENVGGDILDTVLMQMNVFGRIALCGLISAYTASELPPGPKNIRAVLTQRLRMQGLIVFDWADRIPEAIEQLGAWHADGKLKIREDVQEGGLDRFVDVVNMLYTSANNGKLVLKV